MLEGRCEEKHLKHLLPGNTLFLSFFPCLPGKALLATGDQSWGLKWYEIATRVHPAAGQTIVYQVHRVAKVPWTGLSAEAGISSSRMLRVQSTIERWAPGGLWAALPFEMKQRPWLGSIEERLVCQTTFTR